MRMADYALRSMKTKILEELYGKTEKQLKIRKTNIAKQNRELYLQPIQHLLDQLPKEMLSHTDEYKLQIKYTPYKDKTNIAVHETWDYRTDTYVVNPKIYQNGASYYSDIPKNPLNPKLRDSAEQLCKDILELRTEQENTIAFLEQSFIKNKGSKALRKMWEKDPNAHVFCKYLPAEPVRVKKSTKKETIPDPIAPTSIKNRMTTNLLEDH